MHMFIAFCLDLYPNALLTYILFLYPIYVQLACDILQIDADTYRSAQGHGL